MNYCFHHIPKTAGSSLQLRLSHRESIGQLPTGSTMVVYPLFGDMRFYRVSSDPAFDPSQPIKEAFLRTYNQPRVEGNASIVCGHYTTSAQPGRHFTWLRDPLSRDISHFNYDYNYDHHLSEDFENHLQQMSGNFTVLWLWSKYLGGDPSVSIQEKYNGVRKCLNEKFEQVFDSDKFEESWTILAEMLNVDVDPKLNSNEGGKSYKKIISDTDINDRFRTWHREYNHWDYLLYEEFCK
jgi:hypothetical protein